MLCGHKQVLYHITSNMTCNSLFSVCVIMKGQGHYPGTLGQKRTSLYLSFSVTHRGSAANVRKQGGHPLPGSIHSYSMNLLGVCIRFQGGSDDHVTSWTSPDTGCENSEWTTTLSSGDCIDSLCISQHCTDLGEKLRTFLGAWEPEIFFFLLI